MTILDPRFIFAVIMFAMLGLALFVVSRLVRRQRLKLRATLIDTLEQLLQQQQQARDLGDIMALLDAAELQLRQVQLVDPRYPARAAREHIQFLRRQAIVARVNSNVGAQINEAKRTSQVGTKMRYATEALSIVTRWMGHPSLSSADRQSMQEIISDIEEYLATQPICREIRRGIHLERSAQLNEAYSQFQQALVELNALEEIRVDEQNLIADIEDRAADIRQRLAEQSAQPATAG